MNDIAPPENIEGLEFTEENKGVLRNIAHKGKAFDVRLQHLQDLILKSLTAVSYLGNQLFENRPGWARSGCNQRKFWNFPKTLCQLGFATGERKFKFTWFKKTEHLARITL